jgi:hypothetical protein
MTVEEMEARLEEIQREHRDGTLPDGSYADPPEGSESEVAKGAEEGKDEEQPEGEDKDPDKDPDTEDDPDGEDPDKEGDSDDDPDKDPDKDPDNDDDKVFDTEGVDEVTANRVRAAQRRMHQATSALSEAEKENEQLRRQLAAQGEAPVQAEEQPKLRMPDIQGMTPEQAAQFKEDYPDIAPMIDTISALQQHNAALDLQLRQVGQGLEETAHEASYGNFMDTIVSVHDDAEEIRASDEWQGWLEGQPKYVQDAINVKGTAEDVIDIITHFKKDMGMAEATPQQDAGPKPKTPSKLEQAKQGAAPNLPGAARQHKPGRGRGKMFSRSDIAAKEKDPEFLMSDEGEKWIKEAQLAIAEGRITD